VEQLVYMDAAGMLASAANRLLLRSRHDRATTLSQAAALQK
jgi:hypothetical protein